MPDLTRKYDQSTRLRVKITAAVLVIIVFVIALEVSAQFIERNEPLFSQLGAKFSVLGKKQLHLDDYEIADENYVNHWRLRPNYQISLSKLRYFKAAAGKFVNFEALKSAQIPGGEDDIGIKINAHGFKGSKLREDGDSIRILALGDSTTFGTGPFDYVMFMQDHFDRNNVNVEMVNGGVEGYRPRDLLIEVERYKAIKPDIVMIYIGWNAIYSDAGNVSSIYQLSALWRLIDKITRFIGFLSVDPKAEAYRLLHKEKHVNLDSPNLETLDSYEPRSLQYIKKLTKKLEVSGTSIVLLTLPGLFTMDRIPDEKSLEIGHLPQETQNPYVLAKLTSRYNKALRIFANENGYELIDLSAWSDANLIPPTGYFTDTVHMSLWGMERTGHFLAESLTHLPNMKGSKQH
ncbi:SGNH/GDSL hydrolase family protein [Rhodospirillales bacterium]|nr:SGNH/GDSL hydrolase family protein [Rhodospirillales bacterium]